MYLSGLSRSMYITMIRVVEKGVENCRQNNNRNQQLLLAKKIKIIKPLPVDKTQIIH